MELDELKRYVNTTTTGAKNNEALKQMLSVPSRSVLSQIKRSIYFELVLALLLGLGCAIMTATATLWSVRMYTSVFLVAALAFTAVLLLLLNSINKHQKSSTSLKTNLQSIINIVRRYSNAYLLLSNILLPLCFVLAVYLTISDPARAGEVYSNRSIAIIASIMLACWLALYFFNKWYIQKLYGRYTNRLQQLVDELQVLE